MNVPRLRIEMAVGLAALLLSTQAFGQSKCASSQLKAIGQYAASRARCYAKAAKKGAQPQSGCLETAQGKFVRKWSKAEQKSDCSSDATVADAFGAVDTFTANASQVVFGGSVTTTTTPTTGTTTSTICEAYSSSCVGTSDLDVTSSPGEACTNDLPPNSGLVNMDVTLSHSILDNSLVGEFFLSGYFPYPEFTYLDLFYWADQGEVTVNADGTIDLVSDTGGDAFFCPNPLRSGVTLGSQVRIEKICGVTGRVLGSFAIDVVASDGNTCVVSGYFSLVRSE